jgi:hypothetical protein
MEKLKTLREIKFFKNKKYPIIKSYDNIFGHTNWIDTKNIRKQLKQEAIKWIKDIDYAIKNNGKRIPKLFIPYENIEDWRGQAFSVILWIKHFFNITKEDLK